MEQEIERAKEEIKGIESACVKVEDLLERVLNSPNLDTSAIGRVLEERDAKCEDNNMEDIISEGELRPVKLDNLKLNEQYWYEKEDVLKLWNGTDLSIP